MFVKTHQSLFSQVQSLSTSKYRCRPRMAQNKQIMALAFRFQSLNPLNVSPVLAGAESVDEQGGADGGFHVQVLKSCERVACYRRYHAPQARCVRQITISLHAGAEPVDEQGGADGGALPGGGWPPPLAPRVPGACVGGRPDSGVNLVVAFRRPTW